MTVVRNPGGRATHSCSSVVGVVVEQDIEGPAMSVSQE